MGGDADQEKEKQVEKKEKPIWMTESTIEGASSESMQSGGAVAATASTSQASKASSSSDAIMQTLLAHEKKSAGES